MKRRDGKGTMWRGVVVACALAAVLAGGCATTPGSGPRASKARETDAALSEPTPSLNTMYAMARLMRAQGKTEQEELVLRKIVAQEPKFVPAYADLAELRMRQHRYAEAAEELNKGLQVAPEDPVLLNDLGVCAVLQDKPDDALAYFTKASEASPDNTRYRANMALAIGLQGHYEESLNLYRQVMSDDDAQHNLAVIKTMRHEAQAAVSQEELPPAGALPEEVAASAVPSEPAP